MKKLIEEHIAAGDVVRLMEPVSILDARFDEEVARLNSSEARASEMEHAIKHEISIRIAEDPVFYQQQLSERLEEIIRQRRQSRLEAAEAVKQYEGMADELRGIHKRAESLGLSGAGLAVYNILSEPPAGDAKKRGKSGVAEEPPRYGAVDAGARSLAKEILNALQDLVVIDWTRKEDVQREMRLAIKRRLRAAGHAEERIEEMAAKLMDLARARLAK